MSTEVYSNPNAYGKASSPALDPFRATASLPRFLDAGIPFTPANSDARALPSGTAKIARERALRPSPEIPEQAEAGTHRRVFALQPRRRRSQRRRDIAVTDVGPDLPVRLPTGHHAFQCADERRLFRPEFQMACTRTCRRRTQGTRGIVRPKKSNACPEPSSS